jgi:hypothetical protein
MQQALNEQEQVKSEVSKIRRVIEDAQQKLTRHTDRLQELREEKNRFTEECFKVKLINSLIAVREDCALLIPKPTIGYNLAAEKSEENVFFWSLFFSMS